MASVTLKASGGYEAPWIVLGGNDSATPDSLRRDLLDLLGLQADGKLEDGPMKGTKVADLSVSELTALASLSFQGAYALMEGWLPKQGGGKSGGARPFVPKSSGKSSPAASPEPSAKLTGSAAVAEAEAMFVAEIKALKDKAEAKKWATENATLWQSTPTIGAALKARIAELTN